MIQKAIAGLPQAVSTITAGMQQWQDRLEAVGSIRAEKGADPSPQVAGIAKSDPFPRKRRYDASYRGRVRGVERCKSGIAAKDAKNANSLMRADSSTLPLDGIAGAGDRGREADAVFGVSDVVVHCLRDSDDPDAERSFTTGTASTTQPRSDLCSRADYPRILPSRTNGW